jgi:hypothetical protein
MVRNAGWGKKEAADRVVWHDDRLQATGMRKPMPGRTVATIEALQKFFEDRAETK